jgi:hypothetical protein
LEIYRNELKTENEISKDYYSIAPMHVTCLWIRLLAIGIGRGNGTDTYNYTSFFYTFSTNLVLPE